MSFIDKSNDDERTSPDLPENKKLFYLFSSDETDRLKNRNKYIIIYYSEIREVIMTEKTEITEGEHPAS